LTAVDLLTEVLALGVSVIPTARGTIRVRPVERLTPELLDRLRDHKQQILAILQGPPRTWVDLDASTVREALGPDPDAHAIAVLQFDVLAAVRQLEVEIQTGALASNPRLVRGRPLADWLDLDDIARLLRGPRDGQGTTQAPVDVTGWPNALPGLGARRLAPFTPCSECGTGTFSVFGDTPICRSCALRWREGMGDDGVGGRPGVVGDAVAARPANAECCAGCPMLERLRLRGMKSRRTRSGGGGG
jgi:hypothetical protein